LRSPKEGTITRDGIIEGDAIRGKYVWRKEGKADIEYTFEGSAQM